MRRLALTTAVLAVLALSASAQDADPRPAPDAATDTASEAIDVEQVVAGLKSKEYTERLLAAEASATIQDPALTRPLTKLLTDDRYEVRTAVIRALGERTAQAAQKEAAKALGARLPRLAKDQSDEIELLLAIEALGKLQRPESISALLGDLDHDTDLDIAEARVMAVARIPHKDAIEALIKVMSKGRKRATAHQAAGRALRLATGERLGSDPDAWRAWWKTNEKTFDFEAAAARRAEADQRAADKEERKRQRGEGRKKKKSDD